MENIPMGIDLGKMSRKVACARIVWKVSMHLLSYLSQVPWAHHFGMQRKKRGHHMSKHLFLCMHKLPWYFLSWNNFFSQFGIKEKCRRTDDLKTALMITSSSNQPVNHENCNQFTDWWPCYSRYIFKWTHSSIFLNVIKVYQNL